MKKKGENTEIEGRTAITKAAKAVNQKKDGQLKGKGLVCNKILR